MLISQRYESFQGLFCIYKIYYYGNNLLWNMTMQAEFLRKESTALTPD